MTDDGVPQDYVTNSLNQYTSAGSKDFQYDLNGNLTRRVDSVTGGVTEYRYDLLDRLIQVLLAGGASVSFTYDTQERRVQKTTGSGTTRYLWDGKEVLAELDAQGNLIRSYVHGSVIDEILYQEDYPKSETLFFHQDQLMSTLALTDSQGSVKESFAYDPYGNLTKAEDKVSTAF